MIIRKKNALIYSEIRFILFKGIMCYNSFTRT